MVSEVNFKQVCNLLRVTTPSNLMMLGWSNCPMMLASLRKSRLCFSVYPALSVLMATQISFLRRQPQSATAHLSKLPDERRFILEKVKANMGSADFCLNSTVSMLITSLFTGVVRFENYI